ncbi:MAG: Zn-dependent protease [Microgenomates group bacterium GW2011_GWC1_43_11]|uniref:Zn-dependent protease n=1 Tax=Candidatus Gottesmanbacteria bacterium GW2011_GWA1_44_24b TaxID=1618437 RepID=A0A0G1LGS3_9BACT|nr:MAG: Zn-dependent protease [Microgenomates group bacterium GW2011_GWC1_43_11]KKT59119.1 MAG: Zn-dependent protease [Candidatus Gottesmanbacteria bacterium GW2011_GWA1_44_24b]HCM81955.1 site-2 protease family protein [Patescibacteria group bacterium]
MLRYFNNPLEFIGIFVAFLIAITVHEVSHGIVADRLGDPTARVMGRLTFNPLAHLDLVGTLMILFAPFGWAKPVPFDPFNLKNPKRDAALISIAGPAANLVTAGIAALVIRLIPSIGILSLLTFLLSYIIVLNVNLSIFNLIPIFPLDGFHIVEGLLPEDAARQWHQLQSLGFIMIFVLVFPLFGSSPVLSLIQPMINLILNLLLPHTLII